MRAWCLAVAGLILSGCLSTEPSTEVAEPPAGDGAPALIMIHDDVFGWNLTGDVAVEFGIPPGPDCTLKVSAYAQPAGSAWAASWVSMPSGHGGGQGLLVQAGIHTDGDDQVAVRPWNTPGRRSWSAGPENVVGLHPYEEGFQWVVTFTGLVEDPAGPSLLLHTECDAPRPITFRIAPDALFLSNSGTDEGVELEVTAGAAATLGGRKPFTLPREAEVWTSLMGDSIQTAVRVEGPGGPRDIDFKAANQDDPLPPGDHEAHVEHVGTGWSAAYVVLFAPFAPWETPESAAAASL